MIQQQKAHSIAYKNGPKHSQKHMQMLSLLQRSQSVSLCVCSSLPPPLALPLFLSQPKLSQHAMWGHIQRQRRTLLMTAISEVGPTKREVPLSAMAWQPPLQLATPGTSIPSSVNCQYASLVTFDLFGPKSDH